MKVDSDSYNEIKKKIRRLRNENSLSERRKIVIELEDLMSKYKNLNLNEGEEASYLEKHKEEVILKWF